MLYNEIKRDLFTVNSLSSDKSEPYCLAHCISADFGMSGGIVLEFNKRWDMKNYLHSHYGNVMSKFRTSGGMCIPVKVKDHNKETFVFNLVTKEIVFWKPSYDSIREALEGMKNYMMTYNLNKVAMPLIGCGIDGKQWDRVSRIIKEVFMDTDIEILVCWR